MTALLAQPIICPILIGRAAQLATLDRLVADVHTGAGRTALISGEAGVGKSRLMAIDALNNPLRRIHRRAQRANVTPGRHRLHHAAGRKAQRPAAQRVDRRARKLVHARGCALDHVALAEPTDH